MIGPTGTSVAGLKALKNCQKKTHFKEECAVKWKIKSFEKDTV